MKGERRMRKGIASLLVCVVLLCALLLPACAEQMVSGSVFTAGTIPAR